MTTRNARLTETLLLTVLLTGYVPDARAFHTDTHPSINNRAATVSGLDTYLRNELALPAGLAELSGVRHVGDVAEEDRDLP